jgi:hypothetical protein
MSHRFSSMATLVVALFASTSCAPDEPPPDLAPGGESPAGLNKDPACAGKVRGTKCGDDGNECTHDVCDGFGNCNVPELYAFCDDGDGSVCTGSCDEAGRCQPLPRGDTGNIECDDGDGEECTTGMCKEGQCEPRNVARGTVCGPLNKDCMTNECDGNGECGLPVAEGTKCDDGIDPCDNAACNAKGECKKTGAKQEGSVCKPAEGEKLCHGYSCNLVGDKLECQGTCAIGEECMTNGDLGTCREPVGKACACYGLDGTACVGPEREPVCTLVDECTSNADCASGSACVLAATSGESGPYRFACAPCDGACAEPNPEVVVEATHSEEYPSAADCELAAAQGALTLLEALRTSLVVQAQELCGGEHVELSAAGGYEWQCGGSDGSTLTGGAAAYVACLE